MNYQKAARLIEESFSELDEKIIAKLSLDLGFRPIESAIFAAHLKANFQTRPLRLSKVRIESDVVAALSIGGSFVELALGSFTDQGELEINYYQKKSLPVALAKTLEPLEFWQVLIDPFKLILLQAQRLVVTLAAPLEKQKGLTYLIQGAGKYDVPSWGPKQVLSETEKLTPEPLEKSLKLYLQENDLAQLAASISPNDAHNVLLSRQNDWSSKELNCALILGTGANFQIESFSLEIGHLAVDCFTDWEKELIDQGKYLPESENLLTGSFIAESFLLLGELLMKQLGLKIELNSRPVSQLIFESALSKNQQNLQLEQYFLNVLSKLFIKRLRISVQNLIQAVQNHFQKPLNIFPEGSSLIKNLKLIHLINQGLSQSKICNPKAYSPSASLLGSFYYSGF